MTVYYVDKRAEMGGDGSESLPWRTPQEAAVKSSDGDTINIVAESGPYYGTIPEIPANSIWQWNWNEHRGIVDLNAIVKSDPYYVWKPSDVPSMGYYLAIEGRGANKTSNGDFLTETGWSIYGTGSAFEIDYNHFGLDTSYSSYKLTTGTINTLLYNTLVGLLTTETYTAKGSVYLNDGDTITIDLQDSGATFSSVDIVPEFTATETGFFDFLVSGIVVPENDNYSYRIVSKVGNDFIYPEYMYFWEDDADGINQPEVLGTAFNITVGVVDGWWWAASHNLTSANPPTEGVNNWDYTDVDTLGFSTVYAFLNGGVDPTDVSCEILSNNVSNFTEINQPGISMFEARIIGGSSSIIDVNEAFSMFWCVLKYSNMNGIDFYTDDIADECNIAWCQFFDTGHRALTISADYATYNFYQNAVIGPHLIVMNNGYDNVTVNLKNTTSDRLMAGAIQWDNCPNATLNESNNQFRIDPDSHHALRLSHTEGTSYWLVTDATDLPASQDATIACTATSPETYGVDPLMISSARGGESVKLSTLSSCIDAGVWIDTINNTGTADPWGKYVHKLPNIGPDQGAGAPKNRSGFIHIGR